MSVSTASSSGSGSSSRFSRLLHLHPTDAADPVSALLLRPPDARRLLVLAHGAGAGMRHLFMERLATRLAAHRTATLRYQFPYAEHGRRRPDTPSVLQSTVRAAIAAAPELADGLPVLAGGKSMGGRMTSLAAAASPLPGVCGIVFFGFPLHPAGRPASVRADHLDAVTVPMLFLQGERDALAELALIERVHGRLGDHSTLHVSRDADHGFHVRARSGRTDEEVVDELAAAVDAWAAPITTHTPRAPRRRGRATARRDAPDGRPAGGSRARASHR